jgi:DNA polymerase-3 subunit delta'
MAAPDPFQAVEGQAAAASLLRRSVAAGRVAHAYAFVGPPGSGRKATALAFAKALLAADPATADRIDRGVHPDVALVVPTPPQKKDGAEGDGKGPLAIRIDAIREIERLAALRSARGSFKVFIVDEAERMTGATPQALLKTLEEPPPGTVIVLILTRVRGLPPTVLSRCQVVRFRPRPSPGMPALLPAGREDARERALEWLRALPASAAATVLEAGHAVGRERAEAEALVEACWLWYRDCLCAQAGAGAGRLVFGERALDRGAAAPAERLFDGLGACREAWHALQGNVSPRLTVETLLARLSGLAA